MGSVFFSKNLFNDISSQEMKVCWKAVYAPGLASWHAFIKEVGCLLCVCMGRKKFKPQKLCGKLMWESDPTNVLSDLKYVRLTVYRELRA